MVHDPRTGRPSLAATYAHLLTLRVKHRLAAAGNFPCDRCAGPIDYGQANPHPQSVVMVSSVQGDAGHRAPLVPVHHECGTWVPAGERRL